MALRETGNEHCKSGQEINDVEMLCKYSKERGNEGEFSLTPGQICYKSVRYRYLSILPCDCHLR